MPGKSHKRKVPPEGEPMVARERQSSRKKKLTAVAQAAMDSGSIKLPSMRVRKQKNRSGGRLLV